MLGRLSSVHNLQSKSFSRDLAKDCKRPNRIMATPSDADQVSIVIHKVSGIRRPVWVYAFSDTKGATNRWIDCLHSERKWKVEKRFKICAWMFGKSGTTNFEPEGDFCIKPGQQERWVVPLAVQAGEFITHIQLKYYKEEPKSKPKMKKRFVVVTREVRPGQTFTINKNKTVDVNPLTLALPICDVPVKLVNFSQDTCVVRVYYGAEKYSFFTLHPNTPPFIMFLHTRPQTVQYMRGQVVDGKWEPEKVIPWRSNIEVAVHPVNLTNTSTDVVAVLSKLGLIKDLRAFEKQLAKLDSYHLDMDTFLELSEFDLESEFGFPQDQVSKIHTSIAELIKSGKSLPQNPEEMKWDFFMAYHEATGADLAIAIKLQLEMTCDVKVCFPEVSETDVGKSAQDVIRDYSAKFLGCLGRSKHIILLITEGASADGLIKEYISFAIRNQIGITIVRDSRFESSKEFENIPELESCKRLIYRRDRTNREKCIKEIHESMSAMVVQ